MPSSASGQRWYGNGQLSVSDTRTEASGLTRSGRLFANTLVNVEDILFYKNRIRLGARFDWRDELHSTYHSYRPTYYFDLNGYGYSVSTSYSPYKREAALLGDPSGTSTTDVFYRDSRSSLTLAYPRYPSLNLAYNRLRFFDRTPVHHYNLIQHNFVSETGYSRDRYSLSSNYTRIKRDDRLNLLASDVIQAWSGTLSTTTPSWRFGNASASYNIYDTKRDALITVDSRSRTHSVSAMASASPWRLMGASISYSGRFTKSTQLVESLNSRSESLSGGLTFSPTSYFEASLLKSYQIEGWGDNGILEFVSLAGTLSRYLRQGVDTRLSASRTIYQQSNRVIEMRDSLGNVVSEERLGHYTVDTYYGSAGFTPVPYLDLTLNASLTRDIKSPQPDRRYQLNSSTEGRLYLMDNLEGRIGYSNASLGSRLRLGRAFTETVNTGLTWLPRRNLNLSASYIFTRLDSGTRNRSKNLGLYLNYSFRRAFTFYVSYNEQRQERGRAQTVVEESIVRPRATNVQLLIYTGRRSTLTLGYLAGKSGSGEKATETSSRTWNGTLNFQI
ncbi:MAG: hypothetical protein NTW07_13240 [candidate division Zixibacteria bacterium]|nr:hypothetical protein [candidate division Zixibacteria bacterium]